MFKTPRVKTPGVFFIFKHQKKHMKRSYSLNFLYTLLFFFIASSVAAQKAKDFYTIINGVSEDRIEQDIATLAGFGTRHTLSDTLSNKRGIGAARMDFQ